MEKNMVLEHAFFAMLLKVSTFRYFKSTIIVKQMATEGRASVINNIMTTRRIASVLHPAILRPSGGVIVQNAITMSAHKAITVN
jgi:hypothetical protein